MQLQIKISIHAAREGGDDVTLCLTSVDMISIHAAREGGDVTFVQGKYALESFQSTPPVKAATFFFRILKYVVIISIHAAREGGDSVPECKQNMF